MYYNCSKTLTEQLYHMSEPCFLAIFSYTNSIIRVSGYIIIRIHINKSLPDMQRKAFVLETCFRSRSLEIYYIIWFNSYLRFFVTLVLAFNYLLWLKCSDTFLRFQFFLNQICNPPQSSYLFQSFFQNILSSKVNHCNFLLLWYKIIVKMASKNCINFKKYVII